jgi:hypothetical protein
LKNDELEKALEETWKNKDRFYEDTKNLSMVEVIKEIENKYKVRGTAHNVPAVCDVLPARIRALRSKVQGCKNVGGGRRGNEA